jgi:PAS domain S-box-containing protein
LIERSTTLMKNKPLGKSLEAVQGVGEWLDKFSPYGVITVNTDLVLTGWNEWMVLHSGRQREDVLGRPLLELYPDLVKRKLDHYFHQALEGQAMVLSQVFHRYLIPMKPEKGSEQVGFMPQSSTISPLETAQGIVGAIAHMEDVSERIIREKDLEEQITKLEKAMDELKTLKGILPICSYCKNIRDDAGSWSQMEVYIGKRAGVDFSHGICPDCAKKHFPDLDLYEDE